MTFPYLIRMTNDAFADIPKKVVPRTIRLVDPTLEGPKAIGWVFGGYCRKLLEDNEKLQELLRRFIGRFDDPECWSCLTHGQQKLYALGALDGQVKSGGVTQFFWNFPDLIFPASAALADLTMPELAADYEKALESLIDRKDTWLDLRSRSRNDPGNFWEPFQASYDLLDLTWFDDAYFEKYGLDLVARLVQYVQANRVEFMES